LNVNHIRFSQFKPRIIKEVLMKQDKSIDNEAMLERVAHLAELYESQSEFARQVGITRQSASVILQGGTKNLAYNTLAGIIKGTGCNPGWLLFGEGVPFGKEQLAEKKEERLHDLDALVNILNEQAKPGKGDAIRVLIAIRDLCDLYISRLK
jgi:DNA-binding Xre family transcriptional regulator